MPKGHQGTDSKSRSGPLEGYDDVGLAGSSRMLGILKREEGSCRQGEWARRVGMPGRGIKMSRGWRRVGEERSGSLVTKGLETAKESVSGGQCEITFGF